MNIEGTQPPKSPLKKRFLIEDMYDKYLENVKLDKRKMPPYQVRETKRAFYGAIGMFMILQRDEIAGLEITEDQAVDILKDMLNQVGNFFLEEQSRKN